MGKRRRGDHLDEESVEKLTREIDWCLSLLDGPWGKIVKPLEK